MREAPQDEALLIRKKKTRSVAAIRAATFYAGRPPGSERGGNRQDEAK